MKDLISFIKANPLPAAVLFLFFAVYSNSLGNNFQRDDIPHIVNNASIRDLGSFPKLFSRDYFQLNGAVAYRPAVVAVRYLEYRAFGLDPRLWRLLNLLFHACNAALLCWIFLCVSGVPAAAAAGAVLFLLHPAQTETLNYISNGQCDIMCLFFLCLSFLAYLKARPALSLAAFILALFSKEMALAFPLLLAAYAGFSGNLRKNWKVPAGSAAIALLFVLWRLLYFKAGPGYMDTVQADSAFGFTSAGAFSALLKFPVLAGYYLKLLLWPSVLSVEIDRILPEAGLFAGRNLVFGWILFSLLSGLAWVFYRKNKVYALLWLSFILALLPVSGLVPPTSLMQEHFVYIPSTLFCLSIGLGFAGILEKSNARIIALAAAGLVLLASAGRIWVRNLDWRTPLTLAESDLRSFPGSSTAMLNLAIQDKIAGDYEAALSLALEAVKARPDDPDAYFLTADIYLKSADSARAVAAAGLGLEKGRLKPDAWVNAARIYARAGLLTEAFSAAREATRKFPYFEPAFTTLGEILLLKKEPAEARKIFGEAVRLNSRSTAARRLAEMDSSVPVR